MKTRSWADAVALPPQLTSEQQAAARRAALARTCGNRDAEYKLLPGTALRLLEQQEYRCAICATDALALRLDHCHKSGRVRGWLCTVCNAAEGFIKSTGIEPAEYGRRLSEYLK